jgi:hypothetical protein
MTARRVSAFVDALIAGRQSRNFRPDPEEAALLRTAIELRAARPGDDAPDEQFVVELHQRLAEQAPLAGQPATAAPTRWHPRRTILAAAAAAVVLVGGTAITTEVVDHGRAATTAESVPHGNALRTGTFETADGQVVGQIVAYDGQPSWVYMNVDGAGYQGSITCELQVQDGSTVATGTFALHRGLGDFSKAIRINISTLRGARLVAHDGSILASATFA